MAFDFVEAYYQVTLIRKLEELILDKVRSGIFPGTTHACIGQEAVAVGVGMARNKSKDFLFSNHRGHGHMIAAGIRPKDLLAEIAGLESGLCGGLGGSQHIANVRVGFMGSNGITGGQIPAAVGFAKALKEQGGSHAIAFLGDGAMNQGVVLESLNLAVIWGAPVVFVCENNRYAMSSPMDSFVSTPPAPRAGSGFGMKCSTVDGMDVQAVHNAMREALSFDGPFFLECSTYRFCGHSKSDQCVYRTKEELLEYQQRDPLLVCKEAGIVAGVASTEFDLAGLRAALEVTAAVESLGGPHV